MPVIDDINDEDTIKRLEDKPRKSHRMKTSTESSANSVENAPASPTETRKPPKKGKVPPPSGPPKQSVVAAYRAKTNAPPPSKPPPKMRNHAAADKWRKSKASDPVSAKSKPTNDERNFDNELEKNDSKGISNIVIEAPKKKQPPPPKKPPKNAPIDRSESKSTSVDILSYQVPSIKEEDKKSKVKMENRRSLHASKEKRNSLKTNTRSISQQDLSDSKEKIVSGKTVAITGSSRWEKDSEEEIHVLPPTITVALSLDDEKDLPEIIDEKKKKRREKKEKKLKEMTRRKMDKVDSEELKLEKQSSKSKKKKKEVSRAFGDEKDNDSDPYQREDNRFTNKDILVEDVEDVEEIPYLEDVVSEESAVSEEEKSEEEDDPEIIMDKPANKLSLNEAVQMVEELSCTTSPRKDDHLNEIMRLEAEGKAKDMKEHTVRLERLKKLECMDEETREEVEEHLVALVASQDHFEEDDSKNDFDAYINQGDEMKTEEIEQTGENRRKKGYAKIFDPRQVPYILDDLYDFVTKPLAVGRGHIVRCFIERNSSGIYKMDPLYIFMLEVNSTSGRPIIYARNVPKNRIRSYFVFSLEKEDLSRSRYDRGNYYLGKLRSRSSGMEYILYDQGENPENLWEDGPPSDAEEEKRSRNSISGKNSHNVHARAELAYIKYIKSKKEARRMEVAIPSIDSNGKYVKWVPKVQNESMVTQYNEVQSRGGQNVIHKNRMICLHKRETKYDPLSSCIVDFKSRATCVSVKNFQLIHSLPTDNDLISTYKSQNSDYYYEDEGTVSVPPHYVLLQMGKVGQDCFNVDFQYPLSMLQAFSICMSRFDTKQR